MGQGNSWPRNGWLLIDPKCVGDGKGENVHILPVVFTGVSKEGTVEWKPFGKKTIDGCSLDVSQEIVLAKNVVYYDSKEGRAKIINAQNELHNENKKACANCWGHFAADTEEEKIK